MLELSFTVIISFNKTLKAGETVKLSYSDEKKMLKNVLEKIPGSLCEFVDSNGNILQGKWKLKKIGTVSFSALVMKDASPKKVRDAIDDLKMQKRDLRIVMAPYISEASAAVCRENGAGCCDLSGNCLIMMDGVYLSDHGHPNLFKRDRAAGNLFRNTSETTSVILRKLLEDPELKWRLKYLAEACRCSIGMVSRVKEYLLDEEWAVMDENGFYLTDPKALLKAWSEAYQVPAVKTVHAYTLDQPAVFEGKCAEVYQKKRIAGFLTGFSGGARYAPVVRYNKVHLWITDDDLDAFMNGTGCKEVDSGANVVIYVLDRKDILSDSRIIGGNPVVSPVQAYLDLMRLSGRGEEMAEEISRKEILMRFMMKI